MAIEAILISIPGYGAEGKLHGPEESVGSRMKSINPQTGKFEISSWCGAIVEETHPLRSHDIF